ncbi:DNA circularization N-terminal domain-containing protein [Pseudomonas stutzeri]|uniref:DNA circularization protein n=1 Tax=Stutzerimonas stutzeri TaxID=316 RepID=UPI00210EAF9F|nr:DNA circularization N-terminal domain-containing protein [Stutzerimonas stutzeri]MCQ4310921.1 DNA circularization N-terminal domain-containing protein [Stutzerimonas stutzeri]
MAWRDDYRPGAFRGVPFHLKNSTRTGGRRTVLDEYPLRDVPSTQDMGRKARQFNLSMTVIGPDYMAQRDQLIEALEAWGPGTLIHPFYGELDVIVLGDYSVEESTEQGGLARITQNFAEAGEAPRPDSQALPGAAVNAAADQVQAEAVAEFEAEWSVLGTAGFIADEALTMLGEASGAIGEAFEYAQGIAGPAIGTIQGATSTVANAGGLLSGAGSFNLLFTRLTGSVQQLMLAPGNLGLSLLGVVRGITSGSNPFAAFQAQTALFNLGSKAKPVRSSGYVTPARAQQATNQAAVYRLIERVAVTEATRLATSRPLDSQGQVVPGLTYENRDQAVGVRDQVVAELDRQQLAASPERYAALAKLTAALVSDMNQRSVALAPLARYQPKTTMPALLIAHQLYGDARRADEIVARNRIAHPGFIQGGQSLEVLKDA